MAAAELAYTSTLLQSFQLWWAVVKSEKHWEKTAGGPVV